MEKIVLFLLLLVEFSFIVCSLIKGSDLKKEKSIAWISILVLFIILISSPIIGWSLKWLILSIIIGIQAIFGLANLISKKENSLIKKRRVVLLGIRKVILITIALIPALVLPQYEPIKTTGNHSVNTESLSLVDENRDDPFTEENDNRKLSVQFWSPSTVGKYPLVIFSHGAFGYRLSNHSTYEELASNGYIVCSIDHTYHAFMTKHDDGSIVTVNIDFLNDAMGAQTGQIPYEEVEKMEDEWMKLRTEDMSFVLDFIKEEVVNADGKGLFNNIDINTIGLFGHSLGGATSAEVGRIRDDIDAVIVVDGTMLGEKADNPPYPLPILNIYNEKHYDNAISDQNYPNTVVAKISPESYEVVINGSGHMNFTDLPMVAPVFASLLDSGQEIKVDPRECIETTNEIILQFFDKYLKDTNAEIEKLRIY